MSKIPVIIDRARWRSGDNGQYMTGAGNTELLNKAGCMCCLGFIASTVCPNLCILSVSDPSMVGASIPELNKPVPCSDGSVDYVHTPLADKAIEINDDPGLPTLDREELLTELFKDSMYTLVFAGKYEADAENPDV